MITYLKISERDQNVDLESRSRSSIKSLRSDKGWGLETNFYIKGVGNDRSGCLEVSVFNQVFEKQC